MERQPKSQYVDLAAPAQQGEYSWITILRNWMRYFNARYQTYNRRLHFYVYFGNNTGTAEQRQADAADNIATVKPFAALPYAVFGGYNETYLDAMAQQGVMAFGGTDLRTATFFNRYPGLEWGYLPTTDRIAESYADFVCTRIKNNTVSFSGNNDTGHPRVYGFLSTTDPAHPELEAMAQQIRSRLDACGLPIKVSHTFPLAQWTQETNAPPDYAARNMADFASQGVTTIIWGGGYETNQSAAAANLRYYPEWVLAGGDGLTEGQVDGAYQSTSEWQHALVVTPNAVLDTNHVEIPCDDAYRAVQPNVSNGSNELLYACMFYDDIRQVATGVQLAGPRLTPATMDQGFHAIPPKPSPDPTTPACFYPSGDYTCVKDAVSEWWDPNGTIGGANAPGCWRMAENGRRYTPGGWPSRDPGQDRDPRDICSQVPGSTVIQQPGG